MRDDTKLAKIREAMEKENWEIALKIAGTFSRLGEHKEKIKRASESLENPNFYKQLGYNMAQIKEEGIIALKERFSKSWEEIKNKKK
jgi:hypothetical protein